MKSPSRILAHIHTVHESRGWVVGWKCQILPSTDWSLQRSRDGLAWLAFRLLKVLCFRKSRHVLFSHSLLQLPPPHSCIPILELRRRDFTSPAINERNYSSQPHSYSYKLSAIATASATSSIFLSIHVLVCNKRIGQCHSEAFHTIVNARLDD